MFPLAISSANVVTRSNEWSPKDPLPAVKLYEAWSDILPPFIRDNVLDQLVLPKVSSTISAWNPKTSDVSLRSIVFPWLPHVGLRMEQFVDDARRKMRSLMRSWVASDGVPEELMPWKEVMLFSVCNRFGFVNADRLPCVGI